MGLRCQVLQEQGIHCAFKADMQFVDLALGEGDQFDAAEIECLEKGRDIFLIT